jgi:hypothetical protein
MFKQWSCSTDRLIVEQVLQNAERFVAFKEIFSEAEFSKHAC